MTHVSTHSRIRTGTDDFKTLLLHSDVFVDKSLMIQALLEESSEVILITRPRRWGKSLNMDMLRKFFEIEVDQTGNPLAETDRVNQKLFLGGAIDLKLATGRKKILQKLKIAAYTDIINEYQGQFPVILLNLKDVKGSSYQEIEKGIKDQIITLFSCHRYLSVHLAASGGVLDNAQKEKLQRYLDGKLDKNDLKQGLRFLSELLYKHFNQKVYILIDEYDTPINSSYIKFGNQNESFEEVLELFRGIFGSALKSNPYLEKGVITGILRIAKANLFSDLNNVREYTLLDKNFTQFYGFTQSEVDDLLSKVATQTEPAKIKDWYNGYSFGGEIIYNPWSIMQCLASQGTLDYYWLDSGGTGLVDKALLADQMQADWQCLVQGQTVTSPITKQISFSD
ncbi:AAA family ATPase, partial [Candidatus Cardinium hertigii]|uniref:AAA family ATPase n=1 Tax=Candidatus Cardinium hertigii TaxID=247481 RepID=UPI001C85DE51